MNFGAKTWFYCIGHWWLEPGQGGTAVRSPGASPGKPETLHRFPAGPRSRPEAAFTVYAYSLEQARALVAAKVAGETIVVAQIAQVGQFVSRDGASR
jgi:hypothetical protein